MNAATKRLILRSVHLVFSIPIIGYLYSPFQNLPDYAPLVRYLAVPAIAVAGIAMWAAHRVSRRESPASR